MERLADEHRIEKRFTDFDRMAADPEIDAVVIALPNYLHAPVTLLMLQAGKHVLCEKPMAVTVEEAQSMVAAAEAAERKLMIAHVWRLHPQVQWLRSLIDSGQLGQVTRIRAHAIVVGRGPKFGSWFNIVGRPAEGHWPTSAFTASTRFRFCFTIASIQSTSALRPRIVSNNSKSKTLPACESSTTTAWSPRSKPAGTTSRRPARTVRSRSSARKARPARCRPVARAGVGRPWQEFERSDSAEHPDDNRSVYAAQMDHFLNCILEDRQPACDGRQGLCNTIVLEAAYVAARSGSTVDVSSHSWEPANDDTQASSSSSIATAPSAPIARACSASRTADELIEEMDFANIERALVYHTAMRFDHPHVGNELRRGRDGRAAAAAAHLGAAAQPDRRTAGSRQLFVGTCGGTTSGRCGCFPTITATFCDEITWGDQMAVYRSGGFPCSSGRASTRSPNLLTRFPELVVVTGSQGSNPLDRYAWPLIEKFPNLIFETSGYLVDGGIEEFCRRYSASRLRLRLGISRTIPAARQCSPWPMPRSPMPSGRRSPARTCTGLLAEANLA